MKVSKYTVTLYSAMLFSFSAPVLWATDLKNSPQISATQIPTIIQVPHSPWTLDFGARYWLGGGKYTKDLYGSPGEMVSRLTYKGYVSNAAEAFWRLDHEAGIFLKGYFGGGSISDGQLIDEDFPPLTTPYSRTTSQQKDGGLHYFSADFGYNFLPHERWNLAAFAGYHYWVEQYNAFGCQQIAGNAEICGNSPTPSTVDILNNNAMWNSLRLGLNGTYALNQALSLNADLAYTRTSLWAHDFHNLRADIRNMLETGSGNGIQLDGLLNWNYNRDLQLGLGGRWWYFSTEGTSHFEQSASNFGSSQPAHISHSSYGLLLQAHYRFNEAPLWIQLPREKDPLTKPPFHWEGVYLGGILGYGNHTSNINTSTNPLAPELAQVSPRAVNMNDEGFIAGAELGYNWLLIPGLFGLEGELSYAQLSSANGLSILPSNVTTSMAKNINWLGFVRARFGQLITPDMLVYLSAGPAFGQTTLEFAQNLGLFYAVSSDGYVTAQHQQTKAGWTAGGGLEYVISEHLSMKAEYLYVDLGQVKLNFIDPFEMMEAHLISSHFNSNLLRLGINYKT